MPSRPHRTTSRSGKSGKSKKAKSPAPSAASSPSAPHSFEAVFARPQTEQQARWQKLHAKATERLAQLRSLPTPTNALLRTRYRQAMARELHNIAALEELLSD